MEDDPSRVVFASAENLALFLAGVPDEMAHARLSEVQERIRARLATMEGAEMADAISQRFVAYVVARKAVIEGVGFTRTPQ